MLCCAPGCLPRVQQPRIPWASRRHPAVLRPAACAQPLPGRDAGPRAPAVVLPGSAVRGGHPRVPGDNCARLVRNLPRNRSRERILARARHGNTGHAVDGPDRPSRGHCPHDHAQAQRKHVDPCPRECPAAACQSSIPSVAARADPCGTEPNHHPALGCGFCLQYPQSEPPCHRALFPRPSQHRRQQHPRQHCRLVAPRCSSDMGALPGMGRRWNPPRHCDPHRGPAALCVAHPADRLIAARLARSAPRNRSRARTRGHRHLRQLCFCGHLSLPLQQLARARHQIRLADRQSRESRAPPRPQPLKGSRARSRSADSAPGTQRPAPRHGAAD
eukprot:comp10349_c0_seq1/m.12525 comp10349_c0_seq1/g.12525  ORF comp10349_c0_seq1/g.12525 comp10349_c0_seq1/m.12525 type:complete len:331 (-) comp10349_c0_seq1:821-1813(-)